ncbi:triose-phosphate isomerase [Burkholderia thailandensis]|uniref:triose-phosphate isomerase n=1 Tax=Burkholderia thailandensis TaxID=57975 RepID=UPI0001B410EB|nr:triose-phosphate isomerase [Burkholderia thailandensis]MCS3399176.1 triose-phosphate isomerase [Burkholderia thailandensis]MCS6471572.1 triose-phosphate isomerase [Burkholderia thailandensis]MCS6494679.1 triose-phosphate isomerase [Burkholderia thailandensis]MCS6506330.1 triose-phosphate isomerase [Burkholderia thailandensis]WRS64810.1 triose-phosphate isomerase [Burkholderia thailandensis]
MNTTPGLGASMTRQTMSKQRIKRVIGNWKMHGRLSGNQALLTEVAQGAQAVHDNVAIGVCVPFPYLAQAQAQLQGGRVSWGSQDVSAHEQGAYTGEVAAGMVAEFGAAYAIVGHSERRAYHGESNETVAAKARRALAAGLTPIVCVGETLAEREAGTTEQVVGAQLDAVLAVLSPDEAARIVVAYEPVWAIGTGKSATAEQAQQVHAFLRGRLAAKGAGHVSLLYGGSVKADNAAELFGQPDIDGGLIGGASLKSGDFLAICRAAK